MMAESASPRAVVVADDDLLFSSRIASALTALGYAPIVVRTEQAFQRRLAEAPAAAILDLASRGFDAVAAIRGAKTDPTTQAIPLLGFCGHQDVGRQTAARAAGCDLVTTNGAVSTALAGLLRALLEDPRGRVIES